MLLELDRIRIDGDTQPRESIDLAIVAEYAELMQDGATLPPVVVFHDGAKYWLADGFHRYHAARSIGADAITADVRPGTVEDARWYSYSANKDHGLRRTNEDKRRAVLAALKHENAALLSSREIALHCPGMVVFGSIRHMARRAGGLSHQNGRIN
jgi:ParB-like chromosome segregation protein Spo0J